MENLQIDYENTDFENKTLCLIYQLSENQTELPIDVEISIDANKSRLIEKINATPIHESKTGKIMEIVSTAVGTVAGAVAGNMAGGLFGMSGRVVGTVAGVAIGGAGSYIMTSNFFKKTELVKDESVGDMVKFIEETKPVIAAQLLYDESYNTDEIPQKEYFQQKIADTLTDLICAEHSDWEKVSVNFVSADIQGE